MPLSSAMQMAAGGVAAAGTWWDGNGTISGCIGAWQAKEAASLASSYLDLSGVGNNLSVGVAPTWASGTGWTFNGTTQYLDTAISVNGGNYSVIIDATYNDAVESSGRYVGVALAGDANPRLFIVPQPAYSQMVYQNGSGAAIATPLATGGVYAIAGNRAYYNGVDESVTLAAWTGTNNYPVYIAAHNVAGTPNYFKPCTVRAAAIYNATLTAPHVATISAAMALL